jgi:hypothetical protein
MCQNADYQLKAKLLGDVTTLTSGETELASKLTALPTAISRTWEYWTMRLDKVGGLPPRPPAASQARPRAASSRVKTSPDKASRSKASRRAPSHRRKKART